MFDKILEFGILNFLVFFIIFFNEKFEISTVTEQASDLCLTMYMACFTYFHKLCQFFFFFLISGKLGRRK